jgi:hypothetical protein
VPQRTYSDEGGQPVPLLIDQLLAQAKRPGVPCALGIHLAALPDKPGKDEPSPRQQLIDAINDERISLNVIAEYLVREGVKISGLSVGKHRRRVCGRCADAGWFA